MADVVCCDKSGTIPGCAECRHSKPHEVTDACLQGQAVDCHQGQQNTSCVAVEQEREKRTAGRVGHAVKPVRTGQEFLSPAQLAVKLGVSRKAIWRHAARSRLPGMVRFGRRRILFRLVDVEKAILSGRFLLDTSA